MGRRFAIVRLVVCVGAAVVIAAACGKSSTAGSTTGATTGGAPTTAVATTPSSTESSGSGGISPTTIDGETVNVKGTTDATGMTSLEIEADTDDGVHYFSPTIVTGTPGQKITIELTNESSSVPHNFTIESLNLNQDLDPGQSATVTVTLPAAGSLEFHCEYHQSTGMVGQFTTG